MWKLVREIRQLLNRLAYVFLMRPIEPALNYLYDRTFDKVASVHYPNSAAQGNAVAIFLIYQPGAVKKTVYQTIEELASLGFRIVVVSNAAVSVSDLDRLCQRAFMVLERPNYGLDFGGYRDGLKLVRRFNLNLSELLLLNDSVNCLLGDFNKFIGRLRSSPKQATSAVVLKAGRRSEDTLTSYLMHFKGGLLASSIFWDFWSGYQMANSRYQTVRRGERGLSAVLYRSEFVVGGFVDLCRFTETVKTQVSISDLLIAVHYCALTDSRLLEARVEALRDYQAGSESSFGGEVLRQFILSVVEKRPFVASFPYLAHVILGLPIQKWGSTMLQKLALCRTVDAEVDGVMKIHDSCAFREMRELRDKYLREKAVTSIYRALLEPLPK